MKVVNVDDVLKILYKYGKYIFTTDDKRYTSMLDEIANLKAIEQEPRGKMLICPECGLDVHSDFKTCPRCGARMAESENKSGKEQDNGNDW